MKSTAPKTKTTSPSYTHSVGRRKRAVARIRVHGRKSKDDVTLVVNGMEASEYFHIPGAQAIFLKPLKVTDTLERFTATVKVVGSGLNSQLDAVAHGIAKALVKIDESYKPALKKAGLLTRDSREKERRKIGTGGKARRKKQSPKR